MELVRSSDHEGVLVRDPQVVYIRTFPLMPWGLFCWVGDCAIRAAFNRIGDSIPEHMPYRRQRRKPSLIFHSIVQKRSNGLILVSASFKNQSADIQQVGDVRNRASLSALVMVESRGEL